MNNRKNQMAVVAIATVLSVTAISNSLPIMAQEDATAPPAIVQENGQQETAPDISLSENLQATEGTTLKDVPLPDNWAWADESTVITAETAEYPARFNVDDTAFDYSNVEGYSAEGHYVERMVAVTLQPAKQQAEPVKGKTHMLLAAYNAGETV